MFKTYIDNTIFFRKMEYYAEGWILSEMERPESVEDIFDAQVSADLVLPDGECRATPPDFHMEAFFAALLKHIDYDNRVEYLGESFLYNNGGDLEGDTHG